MGDYLAYRAFGVEPSSTYREACRRLAGAFIADGAYERPSKQVGQMRDSAHRGPFVVAGEDGVKRGRSVHEHWDKERHMEEAASVRPPAPATAPRRVISPIFMDALPGFFLFAYSWPPARRWQAGRPKNAAPERAPQPVPARISPR